MKHLSLLLLILCASIISAQNTTTTAEPRFSLNAIGALPSNVGEPNKEFYDQTRTLLVGTSLGYKSSLQGGISRSRVGNDEVVEFPLIFRYQATKGISAYLGVQGQVVRGLDTSGLMFTEFAPTMGIDVQFTPEWDAGIQFMAPVYQNNAAPAVSYELSHPIRLRTGIKF